MELLKNNHIDGTEDKILFNFIEGGPKVEIHGNSDKIYDITFINKNTNEIVFQDSIAAGYRTGVSIQYYVPWMITIHHNGELVKDLDFNLNQKNVLITFESTALGDTIAWMSVVERFRLYYNCAVAVSTSYNELFINQYPHIKFVQRGIPLSGVHVSYHLGWFGSGHASDKNPRDCHSIPLQQVAADILGIEHEETITKISLDDRPSIVKKMNGNKKYVAITTCSTAALKHWNRTNGWQEVVDALAKKGYQVIAIGKQPNFLRNVVNLTGPRPFNDLINILQYAEFFVGLASGLSWLNICLGKKSVTISAIVKDHCEYYYENYKVRNETVCNGCMNDPQFTFQKNDWMWCPLHKGTAKHFECSKEITSGMVMAKVAQVEYDLKNNIVLNPLEIEA